MLNEAERKYLESQPLGRLATVDRNGVPQVRPLRLFRINEDGTIDLGGPRTTSTQRYRNIQTNPQVAFVVDDLGTEPDAIKPGWGRGVEVRGWAEALTVDNPPGGNSPMTGPDIIRIHPERIISWHIDPENPEGGARNV
ncbi:PPOX class F420-dependent oxidoreductase [Streptomyces olivaceiscleroticus]|uniref:PPOX class F420-dependent oxidoreductase n=1 Tax=Streptomyces olivaceiscleroticus TaxID=68245 RepID=A0ABN1BCP7_9ACTN